MWWFRRGTRVLTIGSVHLDTIALSRSSTSAEDVTHIGNITHSVGGSAYNIAANLAGHHGRQKAVREVAVYSILPQHSVLTEIIKYKIDAAGINSKFVRLYRDFNGRHVRGGGYVGILDDKRLIRQAVVDAAMHDANIFQDRDEGAYLESAIAWADALVLDADLAVSIVNHVAEHAHDQRQAALRLHRVAACRHARLDPQPRRERRDLPERKAGRPMPHAGAARLSRGRDRRVSRVRDERHDAAAFDINAICKRLKTKHVVCCNVRESQGVALLAAGDTPYCCFLATPEEVRARIQHGNSAGVVDGALAGFIESYAHAGSAGETKAAMSSTMPRARCSTPTSSTSSSTCRSPKGRRRDR